MLLHVVVDMMRPRLAFQVFFFCALKFTYRGSYDNMDNTCEAITNHLDDKQLEAQDMFVEEYVTDPLKTPEDKLTINIYVPFSSAFAARTRAAGADGCGTRERARRLLPAASRSPAKQMSPRRRMSPRSQAASRPMARPRARQAKPMRGR